MRKTVLDTIRNSKGLQDYLQQHQNEEQFAQLASIAIDAGLVVRNVPTLTRNPLIASGGTPVVTLDPPKLLASNYADGLTAYARQDWPLAAQRFQAVYDSDPNFLDIQERLSAAYYNWGIQLLNPQSAPAALQQFEAALKIDPAHTQAQAQARLLTLYVDARAAGDQKDWRTSAIKFEELREIQADFLDSTAQLYNAYMSYGAALEQQGEPTEALRIYRKAAKLPGVDHAIADMRIAALAPWTFIAQIYENPIDAAISCGTAFESKIWGVVKDKNGRGIARATVQVSSADGKIRHTGTTNNQGGFEVPGLGCTTWRVRLTDVPNAPNGVQANTINVDLNGGLYSGAGVEFRQR
jgi:tetratricopeptide (TPR) repeat protein